MASVTDRSGTITAGGSAQVLMAEGPYRRGWLIQNLSAGDLYVNDLGAAGNGIGFAVPAGQMFTSDSSPAYPTRDALSIWGATTAQKFTAREW